MPIYEYQCDACGERVEVMQKISDRPLRQCPVCNESRLRKLVSASAFRLKGSGWYETDFKKDGKKNVALGSGDLDSGKEIKVAKAGDKSESKESTAKAGDKTESKDSAAKVADKSDAKETIARPAAKEKDMGAAKPKGRTAPPGD